MAYIRTLSFCLAVLKFSVLILGSQSKAQYPKGHLLKSDAELSEINIILNCFIDKVTAEVQTLLFFQEEHINQWFSADGSKSKSESELVNLTHQLDCFIYPLHK